MQPYISEQIHPAIITMQAMLRKIDRLRLPLASRRDVESILVRQVSKEIDRALPWQRGHGRRTATISLLIGQVFNLTTRELHDLKLAAFLHEIGILLLPPTSQRAHIRLNLKTTSPFRIIRGLARHCLSHLSS